MRMRIRLWLGLSLCMAMLLCSAQAQKAPLQASMMVTGHVLVETDGRVSSLEIDHREKLPPGIADLVERTGMAWVFEPHVVDDVAVPVRARMRLRLLAREREDGDYAVSGNGAHFGLDAIVGEMSGAERIEQLTDSVRVVERTRIYYPAWAERQYLGGSVYIRVRIDREGRVAEAAAEQVNLTRADSRARMSKADRNWPMPH